MGAGRGGREQSPSSVNNNTTLTALHESCVIRHVARRKEGSPAVLALIGRRTREMPCAMVIIGWQRVEPMRGNQTALFHCSCDFSATQRANREPNSVSKLEKRHHDISNDVTVTDIGHRVPIKFMSV